MQVFTGGSCAEGGRLRKMKEFFTRNFCILRDLIDFTCRFDIECKNVLSFSVISVVHSTLSFALFSVFQFSELSRAFSFSALVNLLVDGGYG